MPELMEARQVAEPSSAPSEPDVRAEALKRLKRKRDFGRHLLVFKLVNAALWGIWIAFGIADGFIFPWPIFPTIFWAIGLVMHALDAHAPRGFSEDKVNREIERLRRNV